MRSQPYIFGLPIVDWLAFVAVAVVGARNELIPIFLQNDGQAANRLLRSDPGQVGDHLPPSRVQEAADIVQLHARHERWDVVHGDCSLGEIPHPAMLLDWIPAPPPRLSAAACVAVLHRQADPLEVDVVPRTNTLDILDGLRVARFLIHEVDVQRQSAQLSRHLQRGVENSCTVLPAAERHDDSIRNLVATMNPLDRC